MHVRRLIFALPIACVVLVAACAKDADPATTAPATTSAADPVVLIQRAMERSLATTLVIDATVKVSGTVITLSAKVDPAADVLQVTGTAPEPIEVRLIGDDAYIAMDSLPSGKPWLMVDLTKLRPTSPLRQSLDIKAQTGIVGGIVSAEEVSTGRYRGIADLEKAALAAGDDAAVRRSLESGATLAKDPTAIPFEASIDADGRLTALSYTIATNMVGDAVTDVQMSGFGEPVSVIPPPANETMQATAEMYAYL